MQEVVKYKILAYFSFILISYNFTKKKNNETSTKRELD